MNVAPKTIVVFTGNRADYGLLHPVLTAIQASSALTLHVLVGGDHGLPGEDDTTLSASVQEVFSDDWPQVRCIGFSGNESPLAPWLSEFAYGTPAERMSLVSAHHVQHTAGWWDLVNPDWLLVLGDRFEAFAVALSAFYAGVPIAHLSGGDVTEGGCVDDRLRGCLTELATLHFPFSGASADNLRNRGVSSDSIVMCGSPLRDTLASIDLIPREQLCGHRQLNAKLPIILFTQHPIPAEGKQTVEHFKQSLEALKCLILEDGVQVVLTSFNMDGYGQAMQAALTAFLNEQLPVCIYAESLGRVEYLSWLNACDVVVGNSSSGVLEAPVLETLSVTVGPRQSGRPLAETVIRCDYGVANVYHAVKKQSIKAATYPSKTTRPPIQEVSCSQRIVNALLA